MKIYQDLKRFAAQEQRIVTVLIFRCAKQFYVPNTQKQSKTSKNPEINNHLSFDGIIQENIDLSDIYSAVQIVKKTAWKSQSIDPKIFCLILLNY